MKKILTVYYSWSNGNTEGIAKMLHEKIGGDIVRIDTVAHYEGSYDDVVIQGQKEVQHGYEPEIKPIDFDISEYDAIAVGTPTWWYTMAPAVRTFLHGNSFDFVLQNEFFMEENIALARRFVLENFVAKGMTADMAVHDPDEHGGIPNPHVHVMCPIRPMNEDGTWGEKQRREYLFDMYGKPVLDEKGKQKFNAVPTTDWNRPEVLEQWRKAWADLVNAEFEKHLLKRKNTGNNYFRCMLII